MELITINSLELASNLATKQVCLNNDIHEDELYATTLEGDMVIKDYYEDEYQELYENYLDMIQQSRREKEERPTAKHFRVEFMWDGLQSFDIYPTEPDWWTSIQLGNDIFDVHYCEDYNQVCVYLVQMNITDYKHVVTRIPIREEVKSES